MTRLAIALIAICFIQGHLIAEDSSDYSILTSTKSTNGQKYGALRSLVSAGEDGWQLLAHAIFTDLSPRGDTARSIEALWETEGVPEERVSEWNKYRRLEIAKRSENETWALLYAQAHWRAMPHNGKPRGQERWDAFYEGLFSDLEMVVVSQDWRYQVAFRRIIFVEEPSFPLHRMEWDASEQERRRVAVLTKQWWSKRTTNTSEQGGGGQPATRPESK